MAQTTQIVPKFSFPYVEVVINDYTVINDTSDTSVSDNNIKEIYAVTASKGIDGIFVRKTSRQSAVNTFGESNFKKYGQPLMQALHVLEQDQSEVWMMRVMPENATYSNAIVSAYYKADSAEDVADAHKRKFRIKLTSKSVEGVKTVKELAEKAKEFDGETTKVNGVDVYKDAEGYTQAEIMTVRSAGRGTYGDLYSLRVSQNMNYEKEYGIKMYNYEVLNSENGLTKDANYVGCTVTSSKYSSETTTLINDVLDNVEAGVAPADVVVNEDNVSVVYDAYIKFCKELHVDLVAEYESKVAEYSIPSEMMDGTTPVSEEYKDKVDELKEIEMLIDATETSELPDLDEFDIFFGIKVASSEMLPAIYFPEKLTDNVDISDDAYEAADYTSTPNVVDFTSTTGVVLANGGNGYFDVPHEGKTYEDEVADCYVKAFNGTYDKRILSPRRMDITAFFDANYPYEVKQTLADLALARNDARLYLDCGILDSLGTSVVKTLINDYAFATSELISKDIHNFLVRETGTNKKTNVTISYFLASQFVSHVISNGMHTPFVKGYCQLSGHIKDSIAPVVEEYETELKEKLYNNRFNYFECLSENVFQRAVQNTSQPTDSDLLEENNVLVLYKLKHDVESDVQGALYNFSDESVRQNFVQIEKAKYATMIGRQLENFDITFGSTPYEVNHSILHAYLSVTFRGLYKRAIVEIDINKRSPISNIVSEA